MKGTGESLKSWAGSCCNWEWSCDVNWDGGKTSDSLERILILHPSGVGWSSGGRASQVPWIRVHPVLYGHSPGAPELSLGQVPLSGVPGPFRAVPGLLVQPVLGSASPGPRANSRECRRVLADTAGGGRLKPFIIPRFPHRRDQSTYGASAGSGQR